VQGGPESSFVDSAAEGLTKANLRGLCRLTHGFEKSFGDAQAHQSVTFEYVRQGFEMSSRVSDRKFGVFRPPEARLGILCSGGTLSEFFLGKTVMSTPNAS
jgi:hypothetical protein